MALALWEIIATFTVHEGSIRKGDWDNSKESGMHYRIRLAAIGLLVLFQAAWCSVVAAQATVDSAVSAAAAGVVVLDTTGAWRMFHQLKSPEAQVDGTLVPIPNYPKDAKLDWTDGHRAYLRGIMAPETAAVPPNWKEAEFDDSDWVRGTAARACRTPYLERLYVRGKFEVADPAKVKDLVLSVDYHGGAVVYVNGQEVARKNLGSGAALAEEYPLEAFVGEDGKLLSLRGDESLWTKKPSAEALKRIRGRVRTLTVAIPAKLLRRGLNAVAIELVRAPYHKVVTEQLVANVNHNPNNQVKMPDLSWNTCEIKRVQLVAAAKDGLTPRAMRSEGFELWNSDPVAMDYDLDQGEAGPLQPIRLTGARNGAFSGKVVLGSDKPVQGLSAKAGDLKGSGGTIPAGQVQVRFGMPWGDIILSNLNNDEMSPYPANVTPLLALFETAPKEIPVYRKDVGKACLKIAGQSPTVFGAVVSIWVTVKVPEDARPGMYTGQVTVTAEGLEPTNVAVSIKVLDWTIPDVSKRRTFVELVESPETLTVEYNLEPWSAKHCALIAKSMSYIQDIGSHVLYIPLIAQCNVGNAESMVRWIKKSEDAYDYDFSIMDKYLDLAEKNMGKPQIVVFNVWDLYMGGSGTRFTMPAVGKNGPLVTVLDRATGKSENVMLPPYEEPRSKALWKPLFDQLQARMQKRGLEKTMMLGMVTDNWPARTQVEFLKDVSGGLPWVNASHYTLKSLYDGLAGFGYQTSFFGYRDDYLRPQYGWKEPQLVTLFERVYLDGFPMTRWRDIAEQAIFGNMRGAGRFGADAWDAVKDKNGRRVGRVWERYPGGNWGYLNVTCSTLAPCPDGPVATTRYEALREGLQECEARIVIEQALTDEAQKKLLGPELAQQCQDLMVERQKAFWRSLSTLQSGPLPYHDIYWSRSAAITGHLWYVGSGWQGESEKLYTLAGQVAKKLTAK
jgi:hypothetical protein